MTIFCEAGIPGFESGIPFWVTSFLFYKKIAEP